MAIDSLFSFLDSKPLYYKEIDHDRVHIAYNILKAHIKHPPTIQLVGTNGKGSTGRMIAHLAHSSGLSVGHYSSPHIVRFNERIWIDGADVTDERLDGAHHRLQHILGMQMSSSLSYFEYTTLLALVIFEECELVVLEAGLGGEWDATSVVPKELSVITPIGIDHQAFLGDTIDSIATTKLNSIDKVALLAPQPYSKTIEIAREIAQHRGATLHLTSTKYQQTLEHIITQKGWGRYLCDNAMTALEALDIIGIEYDIEELYTLELFGRYSLYRENIRIDVGHNPLAATAIANTLEDSVVLIYNSLDDKDYTEVLSILSPHIKRVEIIELESQRAATLTQIESALTELQIEYRYFSGEIDESESYLVFGSFYTVEKFLKSKPKRENEPE